MSDHIIDIIRHNSGDDSTVGLMLIDGEFHCYTCEDEHRSVKIRGETRIPAGLYPIKLRKESTNMNRKYSAKFGDDFHHGMMWLQGVPKFKYVYIHIGNDDDDTEGCILVGYDAVTDERHGGGAVPRSTPAYKKLYNKVYDWLSAGDNVLVRVKDGLSGEGI